MDGTGYAISEILIFLAIASIIGFLLGWVVFRRSGAEATAHSKLNTKDLGQAESRVEALEALMGKTERRADAAVAAASKAATLKPATSDVGAPVAASPVKTDKPETVRPKKGPERAGAEAPKKADKKAPEPAKGQAPKEADKKAPEPAKTEAPKGTDDRAGTGDEELDEYLTDADKRINKLEKTLERLRGKLDDLDT